MGAKATETAIIRITQRLHAGAHHVLRTVRLSTIYAALVIVLAAAWCVTAVGGGFSGASTPDNSQPVGGQSQQIETIAPEEKGESSPMDSSTPGSSSSQSSRTSIHADESGTTITVNGRTQSIPPDQSFHQSYGSAENGNTTHVNISVDNSSTGSSRSMSLDVHSTTQSSSSDSQPKP